MASQYFVKPPPELPIAKLYSHMISGRSTDVVVAQATNSSLDGYIGAMRSLSSTERARISAGVMEAPAAIAAKLASPITPSYCTGREGSHRRSQAAAAVSIAELPLSLPSDHTMIDGWFLSRNAMRVMRSRIAGPQRGSFVRLRRKACDSTFASANTYSPSRSHRSYKAASLG